MHIKVDQNKTKVDLNSLAICKEIAKIDADKLTQREVIIFSSYVGLILRFWTNQGTCVQNSSKLKSLITRLSNKQSSTYTMDSANYRTRQSPVSYALPR